MSIYFNLTVIYNVSGSRRHPPEHPPESAVCPPLHDYEYVHYPCLVDGIRSPPKTPVGESHNNRRI